MSRWRSGGMSAYSEPDSFCFRSRTVIVRGMVTTYLASLDDLMLKVTGASSAAVSSAIVLMGGRESRESGM